MILNEKNGEQYSKKLELRKKEVVELYFNQRYSALQISKILEVNRNTVNKDVRFWYLELRNEKPDYSKNWLDLQFTRLENQQIWLYDNLQKEITLKERLQIEKSITNIDLSIALLLVKIETFRRFMKI